MMTENQLKNISRIDCIRKLNELSRRDGDFAGTKAANLGELVKAGFPVPDGFVLTTDAFHRFMATNNIGVDSPPEVVTAAAIPADIADALLAAAADLGDVALAVRSSGVAEDLPGASFAGQYETVLDVCGRDALLSAVLRCWSSAFSEHVVAYRKAQGHYSAAGMAVLVQRFIPAEIAGVVFTADPITGERDVSVVSAVRGSGERLVSGNVSPDEWLVKGDKATCRSAPEGALDARRACTVAELARRVEAYYGSPQDIEWAYAGGQFFLLQSRPITALPDELLEPVHAEVVPPPGFWMLDNHITEPVLPMYRSLYFEAWNIASRQDCDEFGLLIEAVEEREIGGWEYMSHVPLGGNKEGPQPPGWLLPMLVRIHPMLRSRIKTCIETYRSDKVGELIHLWYNQWKPAQKARIAELCNMDYRSLSDSALDEHFNSLLSFFTQSVNYHVRLVAIATPLARLVFACRDLLGWDDAQAMELLNGLSEKTSEPARRLAELAQIAEENTAVRTFLEKGAYSNIESLADISPEFAAAFSAYQYEFGCRALQYAFHAPTLAEKPELTLNLIRDQLIRDFNLVKIGATLDEKRTAALDKARAELAKHPVADRERFERALKGAELAYPVREDNVFYNINAPFGLVRYRLLELGNRLAERSQIADRDDVFFLEIDEARESLRNGSDQRALVIRRKAEHDWAQAHPGPATYGKDPGPPPSLAGLPAEVQVVMSAVMWYTESVVARNLSAKRHTSQDKKLHGIAASPGRYTGPVRVIISESEFDKIRAGDVLVCPVTSPVWSMIFPSIGALITDMGGILSHPAIIAREYRVPAVVATGNATTLLNDGQIVTVDGSTGVVDVGQE
jgi:phosphohistidine swiveling domain-containing protein